MASDVVITDEVVLEDTTKLLAHCSKTIRERFETAFSDVSKLIQDWDDADFHNLYNALTAYKSELDTLDEKTNEMIAKAKTKIEMIHALHSMKI